jgi:predicted transposase YbfD/YdcC
MRWRLQRASLSPEEAGLCGCWQFISVWREQEKLYKGKVVEKSEEYSFYSTSLAKGQHGAEELLGFIRGHWSAVENGSHYRRDVSLGEDASKISGRTGAYVMATLRNLVLGLFELHQHRGKTKKRTFPGWRRQLTNAQKIRLLTRTI